MVRLCVSKKLRGILYSLARRAVRATILAMKKKQQTQFLIGGALFVLFAFWLSSNPNCNDGCQSVAESLAKHGLDDLFKGLFA